MSFSIDTAFVAEFDANVHRLAAQSESKFRGAVRLKTNFSGKNVNVERLGSVELTQLTSRHQDTPLISNPHSRRRITLSDWAGADLIDDVDEVKMLISPESEYAQNFAEAINRRHDDFVISALGGSATAVSSADAESSVTLASFLSGTHVIANGSTGLTVAKVRAAALLLNNQDVPSSDRYFAASPEGIDDLLADPQVTSADFATGRALQMGGFPPGHTWMGFTWIMSTRLAIASNIRSCFAWHKAGVVLAIPKTFSIEMDKRSDKNNSLQVLAKTVGGATRVEEARVVQVDIDESV